MNRIVKAGLMYLSVFAAVFFVSLSAANVYAADSNSVDVIFTGDLHSHVDAFKTIIDDKDVTIGGFAKIMTVINEQKKINSDTLVLDAGDFAMGTLFQTMYQEKAPELRLLGMMGFDATTLGNHEYDYRSEGLINRLNTAVDSGDTLPSIVVCNVKWNENDSEQMELKKAFDKAQIKDYTIVRKNGVKIAIIGVFGKEALEDAPTCALEFEEPAAAVEGTINEIKAGEGADMFVCVSHSGVSSDSFKSEDEILAKKVPGLDLIISGHSHTLFDEPIVYKDTTIVGSGEYGEHVGKVSLEKNDNGRWKVSDYKITTISEDIEEDSKILATVEEYKNGINDGYLQQFGLSMNQVLAHNSYKFSTSNELYYNHVDGNLGNLIADSYKYGVESAADFDGNPVDVAIAPSGTIRDTYVKGDITVSDVFNSFSLGIGPDKITGYPLVSVYLTGKELKTVAEVDATVSDFMKSARLYMSGMSITFNPNRILLNKVTDAHLYKDGEPNIEIEDDRLYRVVSDLYSAQMIGAVKSTSYGIISLVPKYSDGTPVSDYEDCIIYENGKEVKAWVCIAEYFQSFSKNANGMSEVPAIYDGTSQRKIVDDSWNIVSLIKNLNVYAYCIIAIVLLIAAIIILIIIFVVKLIKKVVIKTREKQIEI